MCPENALNVQYTSETATLEVLQDGKPIKVEVELQAPQKLVPVHIKVNIIGHG